MGVTNGQHGEQQKVLILNSYIRIFFLFQEKKKAEKKIEFPIIDITNHYS